MYRMICLICVVALIVVACQYHTLRLQQSSLRDRSQTAINPSLFGGPQHLSYGKLPLRFEANQGQADADVQFLAHGNSYSLLLKQSELTLQFHRPANQPAAASVNISYRTDLRMRLLNSNNLAQPIGQGEMKAKSNYLVGKDPRQWKTGVPAYAKVAYQAVYQGIDMIVYGQQEHIEYDFVIAPGADPAAIKLAFEDVQKMFIDEQGALVLTTPMAELHQPQPVIYQEIAGQRQEVTGRYVINAQHEVGFEVDAYDHSWPLVIDPILSYSAMLGDIAMADMAVDANGNVYLVGSAASDWLPTTPNAYNPTSNKLTGLSYVAKLNPAGTEFIYATYFGGDPLGTTAITTAYGIAVDTLGNAYVTGSTWSGEFPTIPGAYQRLLNGTGPQEGRLASDIFVSKLNADGSALLYSTLLGGFENESAIDISVDNTGAACVLGFTLSADFPVTPGALQGRRVFGTIVSKLNPTGSSLIFSTYLKDNRTTGEGSQDDYGKAMTLDAAGNIYITGRADPRGFALKLNPTATAQFYYTRLHGNSTQGLGIAADQAGNAYVVGQTRAATFATTSGVFQPAFGGGPTDAFAVKINPSGGFVYATYLGGDGDDLLNAVAVDAGGNVIVTGQTSSKNFPVTAGAFQPRRTADNTADPESFITKLNISGSNLLYSSYLGGAGADEGRAIGLDAAGKIYVGGITSSFFDSFPTTPNTPFTSNRSGSFIAKIDENSVSNSDLALSLARSGPFYSGALGAYILQITNIGTSLASGQSSVLITLPAAVSYAGFSGNGWSCFSGIASAVTCRYSAPLVPSGKTSKLYLQIQVLAANGAALNCSAALANQSDANLSNNSVIDSTTVTNSCFVNLISATDTFSHVGGNYTITLATTSNCNWVAQSTSDWITINSASNAGNSTVSYTIARNTELAARRGYIVVNGNNFAINQTSGLAVVSAASFNASSFLSPESIVAGFGSDLAIGRQSATTQPLPTTLLGTTVRVKDESGITHIAPLFFVSPSQVNFLIPAGAVGRVAEISITNGNGLVTRAGISLGFIAAALFAANSNGQGVAAAIVLRVKANGAQSFEPVAILDPAQNRYVARPIDLGPESDQVFLILFGTGIRSNAAFARATIGEQAAEVSFAGAQGSFAGLDQVNVRVPRSLAGRGEVEVRVDTSNAVKVSFK